MGYTHHTFHDLSLVSFTFICEGEHPSSADALNTSPMNIIRDCNNTVLIEIQTQIILTVLIIWCCEMTHRNKKSSHNNVEF